MDFIWDMLNEHVVFVGGESNVMYAASRLLDPTLQMPCLPHRRPVPWTARICS